MSSRYVMNMTTPAEQENSEMAPSRSSGILPFSKASLSSCDVTTAPLPSKRCSRLSHTSIEAWAPARFVAQPVRSVWIFSVSGFHRVVATKPVRSETDKQNGCHVPVGTEEVRSRADLRPPLKLYVPISGIQLSRRHPERGRGAREGMSENRLTKPSSSD